MTTLPSTKKVMEAAVLRTKERLDEAAQWYPFPAMIGFMLVLILGGHLLIDLNPRLGAKVNVLPLEEERYPDGAIWLGIYAEGDNIRVITSDRKSFFWQQDNNESKGQDNLIKYLKTKALREAQSSVMQMKINPIKTSAVLAVDQRLKYMHIQPIIHALAKAGINSYGFETRIIKESL